MKTIRCLGVVAVVLALAGGAGGEEVNLVSLIKEGRKSPEIGKLLEPGAAPVVDGNRENLELKSFTAFGKGFDGRLASEGGVHKSVAIWNDQEGSLSPEAAKALFESVSAALTREFGKGKVVENIPNVGDASQVDSTAVLWFTGTEVVNLRLDVYPKSHGYISVVREAKKAWLTGMGPDEGAFWTKALGEEFVAEVMKE